MHKTSLTSLVTVALFSSAFGTSYAACSGDQIEKMIDAGFWKDEIRSLCNSGHERTSNSRHAHEKDRDELFTFTPSGRGLRTKSPFDTHKEKVEQVERDILALESALQLYRFDNYTYPATEQGIGALVSRPTSPPEPPNWRPDGYTDRIPLDPWGSPYQYRSRGNSIYVFSLGSDGQAGGSGTAADIDQDTAAEHKP